MQVASAQHNILLWRSYFCKPFCVGNTGTHIIVISIVHRKWIYILTSQTTFEIGMVKN